MIHCKLWRVMNILYAENIKQSSQPVMTVIESRYEELIHAQVCHD